MNSPLIPCAALLGVLLCAPPALLRAGDATLRYPAAADAKLYTVCWTGSQFVAAGQGGAIFTSPDGVTWTSRHCGEACDWRASAAGGGRIVLSADSGAVATSADGITWTSLTLPSPTALFGTAQDAAWNGTVFMVNSGTGSDAWSSPDGISWTLIDTSVDNYFRGLAVKGTQFASFDSGINAPAHKQKLWTSAGGAWTSVQTDTVSMLDLTWTGDRYIAVGNQGVAATSVDGVTWTPRTTGVTVNLEHVIWTGAQAVAVGGHGTIITSPNGATWTERASGSIRPLHSVAWSGSKLVAVGDYGVILTSSTGAVWETAKVGTAPLVSPGFVGWTGTTALAVGTGGTLYSANGDDWVKTAAPSSPPGPGIYGPGSTQTYRFRLASHAGRVVAAVSDRSYTGRGIWITDPMGTSWTQPASVPDTSIGLAVVWDGTSFTALGDRRTLNQMGSFQYQNVVNTSPDGLVWTSSNNSSLSNSSNGNSDLVWNGQSIISKSGQWLVWTGSQAVAVDVTGAISTFLGGSSWSAPHSSLGYNYVREVVWGGSRLLALTPYSVYQSTVEGPWQLVSRRGGSGLTWTGTRALVATGSEIFSLEGVGISPWGAWLASHFTPAELSDPAVAGPLADPDHDRQVNVVEFATGTDPANRADAPLITVVDSPQGRRFHWPQDTGVTAVTVTPQISFDLDVWDNLAGTPVSGAAGGIRTMESLPFTTQRTAFLRLKVQLLE